LRLEICLMRVDPTAGLMGTATRARVAKQWHDEEGTHDGDPNPIDAD
jgi:hypothetical protein